MLCRQLDLAELKVSLVYFEIASQEETILVEVESPFNTEQLDLLVVADISTRWSHREASLAPIVELIADQHRRAPDNYLAFFSSFDYMERLCAVLRARCFDVPCWFQLRG